MIELVLPNARPTRACRNKSTHIASSVGSSTRESSRNYSGKIPTIWLVEESHARSQEISKNVSVPRR
jgi:hypothetical protein